MDARASVTKIEALWNDLESAPFPWLVGDDALMFRLTTLDTFAAGCIQTFIDCNGRLDPERISVLHGCASDLELCAHDLNGEAKRYFDRLLALSKLVLASCLQEESIDVE